MRASLRSFLRAFVRACVRAFVPSFVRLFILVSIHFPELRKLNVILSSELALCVKQRSVHPRPTVSLYCGCDFLTASSYKVLMECLIYSTWFHWSIDALGSILRIDLSLWYHRNVLFPRKTSGCVRVCSAFSRVRLAAICLI